MLWSWRNFLSCPKLTTMINGQGTIKNQPSISANCCISLTQQYVPQTNTFIFVVISKKLFRVSSLQPNWRDPFHPIWVESDRVLAVWHRPSPSHPLPAFGVNSIWIQMKYLRGFSVFGSVSAAPSPWLISLCRICQVVLSQGTCAHTRKHTNSPLLHP